MEIHLKILINLVNLDVLVVMSTFKNQITSLVQRIQGSIEYEGRVPSHGHTVFKTQYEIKQLRRQLETAIGDENFEEAAQIRDKIKALESKIDSKEN